MIKKIIQIGNKKLIQKSEEISQKEFGSKELKALEADLIDTVVEKKEAAAGISAVQIGILKRIFIVKDMRVVDKDEFITIINPKIIKASKQESIEWEGCLSINSNKTRLFGPVSRPETVKIQYFDINGKSKVLEVSGFFSHLIQHEIDHLEGVLFLSYIDNPENIWSEDELDVYLEKYGKFPEIK